MDALATRGAAQMQGHFYSPPVAAKELGNRLGAAGTSAASE